MTLIPVKTLRNLKPLARELRLTGQFDSVACVKHLRKDSVGNRQKMDAGVLAGLFNLAGNAGHWRERVDVSQ